MDDLMARKVEHEEAAVVERQDARPVEIKICGVTVPEDGLMCADLGADAVGLVFAPYSTRCCTPSAARDICAALPGHITTVGVFVNPTYEEVCTVLRMCPLDAVQLHGEESPSLVARIGSRVPVIKTLFLLRAPKTVEAVRYQCSAFLVEAAGGGSGRAWSWSGGRLPEGKGPLILAGGLSAANVEGALAAALPDAVDVSSSVEAAPGRKDPGKVRAFIDAVMRSPVRQRTPVFSSMRRDRNE
jgi:phosphoribosylanthranilate isomerase